jgi:thiol-disulfide isomerase/thioredoxin
MFKTRFILALLIVTAAQSVRAEEPFEDLTFKAACKAAKKKDKVVLIDFYATWCGPCKMLDQTTWKDEAVRKFLKEKTIALKIDAEVERDLAAEYSVRSYPSIVLIKPDGTELNRLVGYRPADVFLADVKKVLGGEGGDARKIRKLEGQDSDDPMKRIKYARALEDEEAYKESLKAYLWCYDHGLEKNPAFANVRLSALLEDIERLGNDYPAALDAIRKRRDAAEQIVLGKEGGSKARTAGVPDGARSVQVQSAMEMAAINRTIGDNENTLAVFRAVRKRNPSPKGVAELLLKDVLDQLIEGKEYQEIVAAAGDAVAKVEGCLAKCKQREAKAVRKKKGNDAQRNAELKKNALEESAKYYEALLGADKPKNAARVAKLITVFDKTDATFASLIRRAVRAGDYDTARAIAAEAKASLDKNEQTFVREATKKIPKKSKG